MVTTTKKYRPYFSLPELVKLRDLCGHGTGTSELYTYLFKYVRDIEDGLRQENHTLKPSIAQSLELEGVSDVEHITPQLARKTRLEAAYLAWKQNKTITPAMLEMALEHAYINNLMTPEEQKDYEKKMGIDFA